MSNKPPQEDLVSVLVPTRALVSVRPYPLAVTVDNCQELFGMTPEEFRTAALRMKFPNTKRGHKRYAKPEDVAQYLLGGDAEVRREKLPLASTKPAVDHDAVLRETLANRRSR